MSDKRAPGKDKTPPARKDRLKTALKANMAKRKAQARARQDKKDEGQ